MLAFRSYLASYAESNPFTSLLAETKKLKDDLSPGEILSDHKRHSITVRKYESEIDYSVEVEETFEKFKQGAVKDYRANFRTGAHEPR